MPFSMFEVFFLPSKVPKEEEIKSSYTEWTLSTRYFHTCQVIQIFCHTVQHFSSTSHPLPFEQKKFWFANNLLGSVNFSSFSLCPLKVAKKVLLRCRMADK